MKPVILLFTSSIGRKFLMAATGLVMVGFVAGHLAGNLQVFAHPDHLNGYAHFLQSLGPLLWVARSVLIVSVGVHIWAATVLTLENQAARGGTPYGVKHTIQATLASRMMRWTGCIVLAFLLYHLAHFTFGVAQPSTFKEAPPLNHYTMTEDYRVAGFVVVKAGAVVPDVHSMVILGFQNAVVALFYIVAVGLLSVHLLHGMDSLCQTLGLRNAKWSGGLRRIALVFCLLYFLGNLAIPGAVLTGLLQPHAPAATAPAAAAR